MPSWLMTAIIIGIDMALDQLVGLLFTRGLADSVLCLVTASTNITAGGDLLLPQQSSASG